MNEWLTVTTSSPGADPERQQRQVQRGRAARDGTRVRRADGRGELALERRDLGALRHPARENRAPCGIGFRSSIQGRATGIIVLTVTARLASASQLRTTSSPQELLRRHVLRAIPGQQLPAARLPAECAARSQAASAPATCPRTAAAHRPGAARRARSPHRDAPAISRHRSRQVVDRQLAAAAEVDRAPDGCAARSRKDDPARRVGDVREVARLRAVTEDHHRLACQASQEELRNHFAAVAFVMAARAIGVERPHDDRRIAVGAMKGARVGLARQLRPAVHRAWKRRVVLAASAPTARCRTPPSSTRRRTSARPRNGSPRGGEVCPSR